MSKNFTAKTSPKWLLWSIITVAIALIGGLVMLFAGVNNAPSTQSGKFLVVNVTMSGTEYEEKQDDIVAICEQAIADAGLKTIQNPIYVEAPSESTSHTIEFKFDDSANLTDVKNVLNEKFNADGSEYKHNFISVMALTQSVQENLPGGYATFLLQNMLAGVVIAVLAFGYVTLRYKLWNAIVTFITAAASAAITIGLIVITRVEITASVMYAVLFSMVVSVLCSVLFAAKNKKAEKEGADLTNADALSETVPVCDMIKIGAVLGVAIVAMAIVGLILAPNFAWFALVNFFGLVAAAYSALLLGPALFLLVRGQFAKVAANKARYDYKKGKKEKKAEETEKVAE